MARAGKMKIRPDCKHCNYVKFYDKVYCKYCDSFHKSYDCIIEKKYVKMVAFCHKFECVVMQRQKILND